MAVSLDRRFALFEFEDNSIEIGEVCQIEDFEKYTDKELLEVNQVTVNWTSSGRTGEKSQPWAAQVLALADTKSALVDKRQRAVHCPEMDLNEKEALGKGCRKRKEPQPKEEPKESKKNMKKAKKFQANKSLLAKIKSATLERSAESCPEERACELQDTIMELQQQLDDAREQLERERLYNKLSEVLPKAVDRLEALLAERQEAVSTQAIRTEAVVRVTDKLPLPLTPASEGPSTSRQACDVVCHGGEEDKTCTEGVFTIPSWKISRCSRTNAQKFVNDLLSSVYSHAYLATHSVSGARSSTTASGVAAKPGLPTEERLVLYGLVREAFPGVQDAQLRRLFSGKLNNAAKTFKENK